MSKGKILDGQVIASTRPARLELPADRRWRMSTAVVGTIAIAGALALMVCGLLFLVQTFRGGR